MRDTVSQAGAATQKIRAALGPCLLGAWPTPLEERPVLCRAVGLERLWVKREDAAAAVGGGNKVRGLEFLLAGVSPGTVVVTVGGIGSTHCLTTAVHARALGLRVVLAQFAHPETASSRAVAQACAGHADLVVRSRTRLGLPLAVARAWRAAGRLGPRRWIPGGGADARAVVGHWLAGLELAEQLDQPPDAVVAPLGTGTTVAGLWLACRWLGWPTRVVGVRVAPALVANRWRVRWLAARGAGVLRRAGLAPGPPLPSGGFVLVDGLGPGYGHPTPAGEAARRRAGADGLILDSTYSAKAFAALPLLAGRGFRRVLFWHTFSARLPGGAPGDATS